MENVHTWLKRCFVQTVQKNNAQLCTVTVSPVSLNELTLKKKGDSKKNCEKELKRF